MTTYVSNTQRCRRLLSSRQSRNHRLLSSQQPRNRRLPHSRQPHHHPLLLTTTIPNRSPIILPNLTVAIRPAKQIRRAAALDRPPLPLGHHAPADFFLEQLAILAGHDGDAARVQLRAVEEELRHVLCFGEVCVEGEEFVEGEGGGRELGFWGAGGGGWGCGAEEGVGEGGEGGGVCVGSGGRRGGELLGRVVELVVYGYEGGCGGGRV